jgi:hypothetical protein
MEVKTNSRGMVIAGWILSALPSMMFLSGAFFAISGSKMVIDGLAHNGFPASLAMPIGIIELACTVLFLIPRTAFYGAILLTAYLGGAVCTHLRLGERQWFVPILFAIVVWIALTLRDARLRAYIAG